MATTIRSMVASSNAYATNEKPVSMYPKLFTDYATLTPFTTITARMGAHKVLNKRIDWTESNETPYTVSIDADGSGTLTITNYSYLRKWDLLWNARTKELIRVTADPTTSSVSVTRGVEGTSEATILVSDTLFIVTPNYEEGSDEAHPRSPVNTNAYNLTQIVKHTVQTTNTAIAERTYFGSKRLENQRKLWREYKIKLELAYWFGYRGETAGGTLNYRTMGGIVEFLAGGSNQWTVPGTLTESGFDNHLVDVWQQFPDKTNMTLFASPYVIQIINNFAKGRIRISPKSKAYGLNVDRYINSAVTVDLVPVPIFGQNTETAKWAFLLDMDRIKMAYLRKPVMQKDVYTGRADYKEDQIIGEFSLYHANEKAHSMIEGISS